MSQASKQVKLKLEIKGGSAYKFEFKGRLEDALNLTLEALTSFKKRVTYEA